MNRLRILALTMLAARLACASGGADERDKTSHAAPNATPASNRPAPANQPKVLQMHEPIDSRHLTLPGAIPPQRAADPPRRRLRPFVETSDWFPQGVPSLPPAPEVVLARPAAALPAIAARVWEAPRPESLPADRSLTVAAPNGLVPIGSAPIVVGPAAAPVAVAPVTAAIGLPAAVSHTNNSYPPLLAADSSIFCQREIGRWTLAEARKVLGEPHRQRAAVDDDAVENGHIYAFKDPTNRYKELELDFDKARGVLRSVFAYPWNLTWQECRRRWGNNVAATQGNKGRTFYSYVNRHLDVLVDRDGKVISLGLY